MTAEVFTKMIKWIVDFIATLKALFTKFVEDLTGVLK